MSEYTEKRWQCDFCHRNVKRGVMPPRGWADIRVDFYGGMVHCCDTLACHDKLKAEYGNNQYAAEDLKEFLSPDAKPKQTEPRAFDGVEMGGPGGS